ncbi:MAG: MFS transporter [Burkholderiales bacterium]|nr:MFS transporter [Burkholderiales bacterium]
MPALNLYAACLAAICAHSFYTGTRLALAVSALRMTDAPATVGVIMMAYALLPALLAPRIGRAADRHGVRALLHGCLWLLVGAGAALWWLPHGAAVLTAAAALVGLGFNAFAVSIQKLIGGLPPTAKQIDLSAAERRKRNFGTLATASSISSFAGPLLAGRALDQLAAGAVFGLLAVLPMLAWMLSLGWQLPPGAAPVTAPAPALAAVATVAGAPVRSPLLTRPLWPLAVATVMLTVAGDALGFLTPIIGQAQGFAATTVGGIVSAFAMGSFVVRLASRLFIARLREWTYLSLTLFASAAILLLYAQVLSAPALTVLSFVLGAWLGLAQPMTQSLLHQSVPEQRVGEALGARLALVGTAQAAGPLVFGLGAQALGTGPTLALASLALAISGVYTVRAGKVAGR